MPTFDTKSGTWAVLALVFSVAVPAQAEWWKASPTIYGDTGKTLLQWDAELGWRPAEGGYREITLPARIIVYNYGGPGYAALALEDQAIANNLVVYASIDGLPWKQVDLFDGWEYEESLEIAVTRYRQRELASSTISVAISTPTIALSQGCDPDDVFYIEGFGTATSKAQASEADAGTAAEIVAGVQAQREMARRQTTLACNPGCTLTPGPVDFRNTPPRTWKSKRFHVRDDHGNPVPAWWGRTSYGWRAMYACVP